MDTWIKFYPHFFLFRSTDDDPTTNNILIHIRPHPTPAAGHRAVQIKWQAMFNKDQVIQISMHRILQIRSVSCSYSNTDSV